MRWAALSVSVMSCAGMAASAMGATVLTFGSYAPGTVINNQIPGITVSVVNPNPGVPGEAIVWDYQNHSQDIPGGHQGPPWAGGNLPSNTFYDNGLAIHGHGIHFEKRSPAGHFAFDFATPITSFGVTVVDVEGGSEFKTDSGVFMRFYSQGNVVGHVDYHDFSTPSSDHYDPTVQFGNGTINRIADVSPSVFNTDYISFDKVTVAFGGSATLAEMRYEPIPTPTAAMLGLSMLGLSMLGRRPA